MSGDQVYTLELTQGEIEWILVALANQLSRNADRNFPNDSLRPIYDRINVLRWPPRANDRPPYAPELARLDLL